MKDEQLILLKFRFRYILGITKKIFKILICLIFLFIFYKIHIKKENFLKNYISFIKDFISKTIITTGISRCSNLTINGITYTNKKNLYGYLYEYCNNKTNIQTLKEELKKEIWIKDILIQQKTMDNLIINITEYIPFAIYIDNNNKVKLIDEQGHFIDIHKEEIRLFNKLLIITGEPTKDDIYNIYNMLSIYNNIAKKTFKIERINNRRWNLILKNNITVKLPEENNDTLIIWKNLDELLSMKHFEDNLSCIDLRIKNKIYLKYLK
jgi:cell division protein FtsQ